jgi:hypothetical protein
MTKTKTLGCLTYVAIGFILMFPLGMLFNDMNWPLFHSWALAHGSFILAWPLLTLLVFVVDYFFGKNNSK